MNRTIKKATVKRFHYDSHDQLRTHLADFMTACNFAPPAEDATWPHPLRVHLQNLDRTASALHLKSAPSIVGTKHLEDWRRATKSLHAADAAIASLADGRQALALFTEVSVRLACDVVIQQGTRR